MLQASRWETLVWPRWLPDRARLPLIAQITGSVALTALVVGPWWSAIPTPPADPPPTVAVAQVPAAPVPAPAPARPAHVNLDVRHTFGTADLSVTVDGKPALNTTLDGSGKRFRVFGKRAERGFTSTLDVAPGVHVVRVRVRSAADKFDQTRTERFDLGPASVAALLVAADKSGMSLVANHPPPPVRTDAPATVSATVPAAAPAQAQATVAAAIAVATAPRVTATSAAADLLYRLRSMLIAIAGVVASAATGALVQETLKRRRGLNLAETGPMAEAIEGRRRRRPAGFLNQDPE